MNAVKMTYDKDKFVPIKDAGLNNYWARVIIKDNGDGTVDCAESMIYGHEPTQEDFDAILSFWVTKCKQEKIDRLIKYAESKETIKQFIINGNADWFDSEKRDSIRGKIKAERNLERTNTFIYSNNIGYEMSLDEADHFLDVVEVYAGDCYHITEVHKSNIMALTTIEEIDSYNYKANYPAVCNFNF